LKVVGSRVLEKKKNKRCFVAVYFSVAPPTWNSEKEFLNPKAVDSIPSFFGERSKEASTSCSGNCSCGLPVEEGRANGLLDSPSSTIRLKA
jgi:hypothetical protein